MVGASVNSGGIRQSFFLSELYLAQKEGTVALDSYLLPRYSQSYIDRQQGFKAVVITIYSAGIWTLDFVSHTVKNLIFLVNKGVSSILFVGDKVFGWAFQSAIDCVYPVNVVNGKRHFVFIPKFIEKALGGFVFYLNTSKYPFTFVDHKPNESEETYQEITDRVLAKLIDSNKEILNSFEYTARAVYSNTLNAFACPGGKMVVFSQIIDEIWAGVSKIETSKIKLADGTVVTISFKDVKKEDVLAALLGHEMTHVASRHSMVAICAQIVLSILIWVVKNCLTSYLKSQDKEYQELKRKEALGRDVLTAKEKEDILKKEESFAATGKLINWLSAKLESWKGLHFSRQNEYEADITGSFMALNAGYDIRGGILLQEILGQLSGDLSSFFHKYAEFLFTHPCSENRKRAIYAAMRSLQNAESNLSDMVDDSKVSNSYHPASSSPAVLWARSLSEGI